MIGFTELSEITLNDEGQIVGLKGHIRPVKVFSIVTDNVIFWADFGIDYVGG